MHLVRQRACHSVGYHQGRIARRRKEAMAATPITPKTARGNRLLAALPAAEYERLRPELEIVQLPMRAPLHEAHQLIRHVYFPITGVVSMLAALPEGGVIEVATIGKEGMIGLPVFHGAASSPMSTILQIPGPLARLPAVVLRTEVGRCGPLLPLLHGYTQAFLAQLAQSVACNGRHTLKQRLARWLLMTGDRAGGEQFPITHEVMAQMLGVRRAGVTVTLQALQGAGLVRYQHGQMVITDRSGLEAVSCGCYWIIRAEYDKLLG